MERRSANAAGEVERPAGAPDAATAPGASVELARLRKTFGGAVAVDEVTLDIVPGEFVTFLGPSGSGKTTTLNMIIGFAEPDSGAIRMNGRPIQDLPTHRRDIGMVFQSYALFPHMTAADNVAFALKQRRVGRSERSARVAEALATVHLDQHGKRYPHELSGGQQQRIALARAIVFGPRLLLMDEPLGALDRKLRESLQLEIRRLHRELGITFVYVTHDQEEALVLSDRIAVFNEGSIEQCGTPEELYENPRTAFVADFLGESNLFHGRTDRRGSVVRVVGDGFELSADAAADHSGGGRGALLVRPERVVLRPDGARTAPGENVLRGTVRQVVYLGSSRRVEVRLEHGGTALAREQAGMHTSVQPGDCVQVTWPSASGVVVADRPAT
jgi:putative spermidine/putrescine transport system ATP-binding protein